MNIIKNIVAMSEMKISTKVSMIIFSIILKIRSSNKYVNGLSKGVKKPEYKTAIVRVGIINRLKDCLLAIRSTPSSQGKFKAGLDMLFYKNLTAKVKNYNKENR